MKVIRPSFWNQFQCIGSKCTDNCCIGWEIGIDRETVKKYSAVPGELGERLKKAIQVQEGEACFQMNGERCPFLNGENLCDLILELGDGALCEICREHPRFYEWFGEWKEAGLGLCCEEAVRLLLSEKQPLKFETVLAEGEESFVLDSPWLPELVKIRGIIFEKLQNRGKSIKQRAWEVLELAKEVQDCMDREDPMGLERIVENADKGGAMVEKMVKQGKERWIKAGENLLELFSDMEPMDENWPNRLRGLKEILPELYVQLDGFASCEKDWKDEWEHLAVYSIFRYFLKGMDDEDVLSKVRMALAGLGLIRLLHLELWRKNGKVTLRERICNIKAYSKELEYSPENLEKLMDAMWEEMWGGTENLCMLL